MEAIELTILAIDDNRDNLTTVKAVVSDRLPGARVLTAQGGRKGLELALAEDPDVILLDIVMPDMDGFAVCRHLKEDDRLQNIPVVFLTALRTDRESRIRALEAGAEGFLLKPFDEVELVAQIRAMAKIKAANMHKLRENEQLAALVDKRTRELNQELTERKQAEKALRESEDRLAFAMHMSHTGAWELNLLENTVQRTDIHDRIFGYDTLLPHWTYEMFLDHVLPGDRPEVDQLFRKAVAAKSEWNFQCRIRRNDGEVRWIWAAGTHRRNREGHPVLMGIVQDITESKHAKEKEEKLKTQLNQVQKMESVGRLAGGVAHDFNNMLQTIIGYSDLTLAELDARSPLHENLREIRKAAERSADLTRQLLAFARKQTVTPRVLDLNDTVAGMLKMLQRLIGENIDLAWMPGHELWSVKIDPSQIDQILANLAINARDAIADTGKIAIATENTRLDEAYRASHPDCLPGEYVLLLVHDTGCGMDQATLEQIFEPFFTTKEQGKGTGLGLATVYGIVRQNNGHLTVQSEPGQGTTFRIYLPRFAADPVRSLPECVAVTPAGGDETVLIVEDEKAILTLGKAILEMLGYSVLTAGTPAEALRLAHEHPGDIHLLITDVVMPGMNGHDLAKKVAAHRPAIRCLYMSGYTADIIARHGLLEEGLLFIQKPFSVNDLACAVRQALRKP